MFNNLQILIILRLSKILPFLEELEHFRFFIKAFNIMKVPFLNLVLTLYSFYFIYVVIGVEIFGGKINGSIFEEMITLNNGVIPKDYVWLSFNDFFSGLIVLFSVQICNNWQFIWMQFNYSIGGKSYITNMYFISFLVMSNYVIINILMAFVIDIYGSVRET